MHTNLNASLAGEEMDFNCGLRHIYLYAGSDAVWAPRTEKCVLFRALVCMRLRVRACVRERERKGARAFLGEVE